jgi:lysophospholipase L1-like esterase
MLPLTTALIAMLATSVTAAPEPAKPNTYLAPLKAELAKDWPNNRTINLVFHGHSVPAGYFQTPDVRTFEAYPHQLHVELKKLYPHAVINVIVTAIGGETSDRGAKRFDSEVLVHRPDVLFIDYALNDRGIGLEAAEKAWSEMIEKALAKKVPVILLTPTWDLSAKPLDSNDPLCKHAEQIKKLASKYGVGLVDSLAQFQKAATDGVKVDDLMSQVNHPNAKGHALVAAELLKWFK